MAIYKHLEEFGGFAVRGWEPGEPLLNLETTIYRIAIEWESAVSWADKFKAYMQTPGAAGSRGLVVGQWAPESEEEPTEAIEVLTAAASELPHLQVLFFGDITSEENEISWIQNADQGPLFQAFPGLRHYGVRGGNGLRFRDVQAPHLQSLVVQSGGLSTEAVQDLMGAQLPELTHLELYLGTENYGADYNMADFTPLLGGAFPKLKYLGLKNAENQDEIAQVIVNAPVLENLDVLDLSLGTLTDEGAQALLNSPAILKLKKLDLHHHFLTEEMMERLEALPIEIDLSEENDPEDEWRFVSISE